MFADRVDIRSFEDWASLRDREIQFTLREVETKTLAVALKGKGKGIREVERRIMVNVSRRVGKMIREEMEFTQFSPEETEAAQRRL